MPITTVPRNLTPSSGLSSTTYMWTVIERHINKNKIKNCQNDRLRPNGFNNDINCKWPKYLFFKIAKKLDFFKDATK